MQIVFAQKPCYDVGYALPISNLRKLLVRNCVAQFGGKGVFTPHASHGIAQAQATHVNWNFCKTKPGGSNEVQTTCSKICDIGYCPNIVDIVKDVMGHALGPKVSHQR